MTHPLTDEICGVIARNFPDYSVGTCMRAAANWQLEQVVDWIEATLTAGDVIADDLKKAMRPQEES
jgi:hypothetical protein